MLLYHRKFLLTCVLLCGFAAVIAQKPKADFVVNTTAGCTPLFVQFTNTSTNVDNTTTKYQWDLGDGNISFKPDPGNIYFDGGAYTVKLVVTNADGQKDSVTKTGIINVYAKPDVEFSVTSQSAGCPPLRVDFGNQTTAGSGTLTEQVWDFGDGNIFEGANASHTYTTSDTFSVTLTAQNSFGCKQTLQQKNLIQVYNKPDADFKYDYANACQPPTIVNFKNTSSSKEPVTFAWNFGDGNTSTQQNPTHTYTTKGTFNPQLVITTPNGCMDTISKPISIGSVTADFDFTTGACLNQPIAFTNTSSPAPVSATWNFGDGKTSSSIDATHTYSAQGDYNVTLTANFGSCTGTITKKITVLGKPVPAFSVTGITTGCNLPANVQFNNSSSGGVSYKWDFGDGNTSTDVSPSHTYSGAGFYTVTLIVFNTNGCSDTLTKQNLIKLGPPDIVNLKDLPAQGCLPLVVNTAATIQSPEPIIKYSWDFGDGATSSDAAPSHTYNTKGAYDVSLIVATASGCADTLKLTGGVLVGDVPVAAFSGTPRDACSTKFVTFTDESTGGVSEWLWDFGDGKSSTEQNPKYKYSDTGYFTVTLTVFNNGCSNSVTVDKYIHILPPIAKFQLNYNCTNKFTRNFIDKSLGATNYQWDFGDSSPLSTDKNPTHTYTKVGTYIVKETVTNGTCSDMFADTLNIVDQSPTFSYTPPGAEICRNDTITFTAENYDITSISGIAWNFGDGSSVGLNNKNNIVKHVYAETGNYDPLLIIRYLDNCKDTIRNDLIKLRVYGPAAAYDNDEGNCLGITTNFKDLSTTDSAHPINKWVWDYGDGTVQTYTSGPFGYQYSAKGTYSVKLTVYNSFGCVDSVSKTDVVSVTQPTADFGAISPIRCTSSPVQFQDSSLGNSLNYTWDFGDGTTSSEQNPQHTYTTQKDYSVKLIITDKFGCTDSSIKANFVTISNPVAAFQLTDTFGTCPPLLIKPVNNSQNYSDVLWDFQDGNTSDELNPSHLYITAGTYFLTLIAHGYGECYDTASKKIILRGPSGTFSYSDFSGCNPVTVKFKAITKNTVNLIWSFGDGATEATDKNAVTYTYETPGKFLPKLILIDSAGCRVGLADKDTVVVSDVIPRFSFEAMDGCDSALVTFSDSTQIINDVAAGYNWDFGDNTTSTQQSPQHYYKKPGTYNVSLTVASAISCSKTYTAAINVTVFKSPVISFTVNDTNCVGVPVTFIAKAQDGNAGINWQWQFGDGFTAGSDEVVYQYTQAGNYNVTLTATDSNGCTDVADKPIVLLPPPAVDAGNNITLCVGSDTTLQATGAGSYLWTANTSLSCTACSNPIAKPDSTVLYFVKGTSTNGCAATDSVLVTVKQPPNLTVSANDTLCIGKSVQLFASGAEVYTWQPAASLNNNTIANPVASPTATTTYQVTGSDSSNCFSDMRSITVFVYPYPAFNIVDSVLFVDSGGSDTLVTANSPDIIRWQWDPSTWLSCAACAQPVVQPKGELTYTATAYNAGNCSTTDKVTIKILCKGAKIFIPNTFSPNNDGVNDKFFARGAGSFMIRSMRVFNRWGEEIFERTNLLTNQPDAGWDGTYKQKDAPEGVYIYVMELICDNNSIYTIKGDVTLLR